MIKSKRAWFQLVLLCVLPIQVHAATIVIDNIDGPAEGFNDPTDASTIAAQAGNNPGQTLGALRLNVFNEAARILGAELHSDMPITISAAFDPLPCTATSGTLGQASATSSVANSQGSVPNVAYVIALAESFAGANLNSSQAEVNATFNSDVDAVDTCLGDGGFYYGLDGNIPVNMVGLFPLVLHEISHGLGFSSLSDVEPNGTGSFVGAGLLPDSFSKNLHDQETGKSWDIMTNAERKASAINEPNLVWKGTQVTADSDMHLGPAPEFVINAPSGIAGTYPTVLGEEPTIVIPGAGVSGSVIDGHSFMDLDSNPADGCRQISHDASFSGKVVLFDKSPDCGAVFPAFWSQFKGAIAVIIAAKDAGGLPDVSGQVGNQEITIPYVGVSKSVGDSLRANLNTANVTIRNSSTVLIGTNAGRVVMHAPSVYETGSSVSHWGTSAAPNLLMEPEINSDLVHGSLDLTKAAFKDIGWQLLNAPVEIARPTGVRATDGTFTDKVSITFNGVAGATVYRVFRCLTKGQTCGKPIGFPKTTAFDDRKGIAGQTYFYRVRACTATKCGKFSVANPGFRSAAPARPTTIRASDGTYAKRVRITWDAVPGTFVYRVFRCPATTGDCGRPVGFPKFAGFNDFKGDEGVVYHYRIRACTETICGKFSVQNPGHRGSLPSARMSGTSKTGKGNYASTESPLTNKALPGATPIPVLASAYARWLLALMMLGLGLWLIKRRHASARKQGVF